MTKAQHLVKTAATNKALGLVSKLTNKGGLPSRGDFSKSQKVFNRLTDYQPKTNLTRRGQVTDVPLTLPATVREAPTQVTTTRKGLSTNSTNKFTETMTKPKAEKLTKVTTQRKGLSANSTEKFNQNFTQNAGNNSVIEGGLTLIPSNSQSTKDLAKTWVQNNPYLAMAGAGTVGVGVGYAAGGRKQD